VHGVEVVHVRTEEVFHVWRDRGEPLELVLVHVFVAEGVPDVLTSSAPMLSESGELVEHEANEHDPEEGVATPKTSSQKKSEEWWEDDGNDDRRRGPAIHGESQVQGRNPGNVGKALAAHA